VPATRRQSREQRSLGRGVIEVKRLRIELAGEGLDLRLVHGMCSARESLSDMQIFEVEAPVQIMLACFGHGFTLRSHRLIFHAQ